VSTALMKAPQKLGCRLGATPRLPPVLPLAQRFALLTALFRLFNQLAQEGRHRQDLLNSARCLTGPKYALMLPTCLCRRNDLAT
jgi:hypothetical protein